MPTLMDVTEVAQLLNVSEDRVRRLARAGIIPAIKVGHLLRFDRTKIARWIESGGQSYDNHRQAVSAAN